MNEEFTGLLMFWFDVDSGGGVWWFVVASNAGRCKRRRLALWICHVAVCAYCV